MKNRSVFAMYAALYVYSLQILYVFMILRIPFTQHTPTHTPDTHTHIHTHTHTHAHAHTHICTYTNTKQKITLIFCMQYDIKCLTPNQTNLVKLKITR